jgi:hypothetical protein
VVDGKTANGDPGDLFIRFNNGGTEVLTDLFSLSVDKNTLLTITLMFTQTADLDLFVLAEDGNGGYDVLESSTLSQGVVERIAGFVPAGNYLIAVGAFSGSSAYSLTLQEGIVGAFSPGHVFAPTGNGNERYPALVERKRR